MTAHQRSSKAPNARALCVASVSEAQPQHDRGSVQSYFDFSESDNLRASLTSMFGIPLTTANASDAASETSSCLCVFVCVCDVRVREKARASVTGVVFKSFLHPYHQYVQVCDI